MALINEVTSGAALGTTQTGFPTVTYGRQRLVLADCLDWLAQADQDSVSAVVTDPPYGLIEYSKAQQKKLRAGRGGVWRIPPSFDGANRLPLPRFTVLDRADRDAIVEYFRKWGVALLPVLRPGAHVVIAGNPLIGPEYVRRPRWLPGVPGANVQSAGGSFRSGSVPRSDG